MNKKIFVYTLTALACSFIHSNDTLDKLKQHKQTTTSSDKAPTDSQQAASLQALKKGIAQTEAQLQEEKTFTEIAWEHKKTSGGIVVALLTTVSVLYPNVYTDGGANYLLGKIFGNDNAMYAIRIFFGLIPKIKGTPGNPKD